MNEKLLAAEKSIEFINDGMVVGLGTGSTVNLMLEKLAERIKTGLQIQAVCTSKATFSIAASLGIKVLDIDSISSIDLTIDGADEVDAELNGIKGGGGALLFEKIVASISDKNIWIVDSSKLVKQLGKFPLPVEVISFGATHLFKMFKDYGYNPAFRMHKNSNFVTDNGNLIIDLHLNSIENSVETEMLIKTISGVIEVGLFNDIADLVIVGRASGIELLEK